MKMCLFRNSHAGRSRWTSEQDFQMHSDTRTTEVHKFPVSTHSWSQEYGLSRTLLTDLRDHSPMLTHFERFAFGNWEKPWDTLHRCLFKAPGCVFRFVFGSSFLSNSARRLVLWTKCTRNKEDGSSLHENTKQNNNVTEIRAAPICVCNFHQCHFW